MRWLGEDIGRLPDGSARALGRRMSIAKSQTKVVFSTYNLGGSYSRVSGIGASESTLGVGDGTR